LFREAKVRIRQAKEAKDLDKKNKANIKELKKANKLYNDRIAEEKRKKAARDREAQAKAKAKERKAINA
jgi:hypothetical protein